MAAYVLLWIAFVGLTWAVRPGPVRVSLEFREVEPFRLDLNRASVEELMLIDGIGPRLAEKIVAARKEREGFETLEDVLSIPRIPDAPLLRGQDYFEFGPYRP